MYICLQDIKCLTLVELSSDAAYFINIHDNPKKPKTGIPTTPIPYPHLYLNSPLVFIFFAILSHSGRKLCLPPSLLRFGFMALIKIASSTPLLPTDHLYRVIKIT